MIGYLFLLLALAAAALTLNALHPIRSLQAMVFQSFIAGWIASELVLQLLLIEVALTTGFVYEGALESFVGRAALVIMIVSWIGMALMLAASQRTSSVLEPSLSEALSAHRLEAARVPPAPSRLLMPFVRSDPGVVAHLDLRYAEGAGARHLLDVYTAKPPRKGAPVLLQIHGGGWFTGHKRQQAMPLLLHMARCGFVCVSANYRLCPRATFPEPIVDVKLALSWIREHIAEYGGDPQWVAITGGSAGGHLAALAALTPSDPEYQPGFEHVDTHVRACVPLYGVYDFTDRHRHQHHGGLNRLVSRWLLKKSFERDREAFERASPMSRIGPHAPPFFVIHGANDNLVPVGEARDFVRLLAAASQQPVAYAELPGAHHGFEIFHSFRTAKVVHAVARFLFTLHARDAAQADKLPVCDAAS